MNQQNAKYDHVYVVIRFDPPVEHAYPGNSIVVTKVYHSEQAAIAEVDRLNELNADKGCRYFQTVGRMVRE